MALMLQAERDAAAVPADAVILAASVGDPQAFATVFERPFAAIHRWRTAASARRWPRTSPPRRSRGPSTGERP